MRIQAYDCVPSILGYFSLYKIHKHNQINPTKWRLDRDPLLFSAFQFPNNPNGPENHWCPGWHILRILLPRAVGTINRFFPPPSYDPQVNPKSRKADRSYSWSPCFDSILIKTPAIKWSCKLSSTNLKEPKDSKTYKVLGRI